YKGSPVAAPLAANPEELARVLAIVSDAKAASFLRNVRREPAFFNANMAKDPVNQIALKEKLPTPPTLA
ncbi:MAG: hypothetical protein ABSD12_21400, partial [Paraburkholderia sp.]